MRVREAVLGDAPAIAAIHVRSWQAAYRGLLADESLDRLDEDEFRRWRTRRLAEGSVLRAATLVVEERGSVVGFADVGPARDADAAGAGEIYAIYLDPPVWRRGLGGELLEAAVARLRDEGFEAGLLWVLEANAAARRFYEATGWVHDGRRKFASIHDVQVLEVRYVRDFVKFCT